MNEWIRFDHAGKSKSGKTDVWTVTPNSTGSEPALGTVSWFSRWRCYVFIPADSTVFEKDCLRKIATFCEEQTKAHRGQGKVA